MYYADHPFPGEGQHNYQHDDEGGDDADEIRIITFSLVMRLLPCYVLC